MSWNLMLNYSHVVVIATRNRIQEICNVLSSLHGLTNSQEIEVLVVENSESIENIDRIRSYILQENLKFGKITIVSSKPGLPKARNTALDLISSEIVTFIDDDILLPTNYIEIMDRLFSSEPDLVGSSPFIATPTSSWMEPPTVEITDSKFSEPGQFSEWGINKWFSFPPLSNKRVNWLPGCAMTVRSKQAKKVGFSESLQNGPAGGYALGEDVDFSFRLSKLGNLMINHELSILHNLSPTNRVQEITLAKAQGYWSAHLVRNLGIKLSRILWIEIRVFLWSLVHLNVKSTKLTFVRIKSFIKFYFLVNSR